MSSTTLKIIAAVMVSLALIFGLLLVNFYKQNELRAKRAEEKAQQIPQTLAVVATKPLAAYKAIDRESVALVPVSVAPKQYFTNLDDVISRVPLVDIDAGAPVTQRYFKESNALARVIPQGFQAVSIEVSDVIAVGGFVRPGDIVDVLLYLRGGSGIGEPQSRVLLPAIRVLAYEERVIERPEGLKAEEKSGGSGQNRRSRTAVLAIPEAETTKVMLGVNMGEIRLALLGQTAQGDVANNAQSTDAGLPLSGEAVQAKEDQKVPDKAVTITDIARVKPPPAAEKKAPPPPTVEVFRGSERSNVVTRN